MEESSSVHAQHTSPLGGASATQRMRNSEDGQAILVYAARSPDMSHACGGAVPRLVADGAFHGAYRVRVQERGTFKPFRDAPHFVSRCTDGGQARRATIANRSNLTSSPTSTDLLPGRPLRRWGRMSKFGQQLQTSRSAYGAIMLRAHTGEAASTPTVSS